MAVSHRVRGVSFVLWFGLAPTYGEPQLEALGHPYRNTKVRIEWSVASNAIPPSIRVFNVSPARWSFTWLSNLVALGEFKKREEAMAALWPALRGRDTHYTDDGPQGSRTSLVINPSMGRFLYYREGVIALPKQPVEGVPSEEDALRAALALFPKLGLSPDDLLRRPGTQRIHYTRDLTTRSSYGNAEKRVIARGLYLVRAVDGFGINGIGTCGGMRIRFGNHGKIAEMEIVWPELDSPRTVTTANKTLIVDWIRQGKTTIATDIDPARIQELTITNATLWYFGHNATQSQRRMYPFVCLDAITEVNGRKENLSINCPIIDD